MTKEEIKNTIETAKIIKDNTTEILVFFNKEKAYCVHACDFGDGQFMVITKLVPRPITEIYELPDEIESMKAMWFHEIMEEFGGLPEAMESLK